MGRRCIMPYVHQVNILNKIERGPNGYRGLRNELRAFYNDYYLPMHSDILNLSFDRNHRDDFNRATTIFSDYRSRLKSFATSYDIKAQSKFESSFLEVFS